MPRPSCCPFGGAGFTTPELVQRPAAARARRAAPPCSHPNLPVLTTAPSSFPAAVFAHLWASWNTALDPSENQPQQNRIGCAQAAPEGSGQPRWGEAIIPFCGTTSPRQMEVMTASDWLASSRTLSNYSPNKFCAWQAFPLPVPIPWSRHGAGRIPWEQFLRYAGEKRKGFHCAKA